MSSDFSHHKKRANELTERLVEIMNDGGFLFEEAEKLAEQTRDEMINAHSQINRDTEKGKLTRSAYGRDVANDHYVVYFNLTDKNGTDVAFCGLGYDLNHWIITGKKQIPWRIFLFNALGDKTNEFPDYVYVEEKLQKYRDGITWVGDKNWKKGKGKDHPFILIPEDKLPTESQDDPSYPQKLAEVVFNFLDELFKS